MMRSILPQARGEKKADLVLKNARILDVFQEDIIESDLALASGYILGWGDYFGEEEIDVAGSYVAPAFIDPHMHVESSQMAPAHLAREITARGITTVVADPHEIANVAGLAGIRYLLAAGRVQPWNFYLMLPSCVPATPWEEAGAELSARDLSDLLPDENILGLGEVMDYRSVITGEENIWEKLDMCRGSFIDGHAPELGGSDLNAYLLGGIKADHECTTAREALEKVSRGMYVMIREGSVTRDLTSLLPAVNDSNLDSFMFATDDKDPRDIMGEGHLDRAVRLAISEGMKPERAYRLATLNPARALGFDRLGAVAPGRRADLIILDDLEDVKTSHVIKDGEFIFREGEWMGPAENEKSGDPYGDHCADEYDGGTGDEIRKRVFSSVNCDDVDREDFVLPAGKTYRVIELRDEQVITGEKMLVRYHSEKLTEFMDREVLSRLAAVERHRASGKIGLGLVRGFGLRRGALATSISHDSHNIMVLGRDPEDMERAVREIISTQGGMAVVDEGRVMASLELPIAGLMADRPAAELADKARKLREAAGELGVDHPEPFMQLSFLSLPVIPELKLTVNGLFDVRKFEHVPLVEDGM